MSSTERLPGWKAVILKQQEDETAAVGEIGRLAMDLAGSPTQYAAHAYPRRIYYIGALPRTPSGKVQRFVLRQQLCEGRVSAHAPGPA